MSCHKMHEGVDYMYIVMYYIASKQLDNASACHGFSCLQDHLSTSCQFEVVDCPNRCGTCVLRKDVSEHCEKECEHRMVVCAACKQRVPHADNMVRAAQPST